MYHKSDHRLNKQIQDLQRININISLRTIILYSALYLLVLPFVVLIAEWYNANLILYLYLIPLLPVSAVTYLLFTGKISFLIKILHRLTVRRS